MDKEPDKMEFKLNGLSMLYSGYRPGKQYKAHYT